MCELYFIMSESLPGRNRDRGNLHDGRVGSSSHTYLIFVHNIDKIHGGMDFYNTVSLFVENVFR